MPESETARAAAPLYNHPVMLLQPITPLIVKVVEAPSEEIGVADVLVKSFGIVGLLLAGALAAGIVLGGLLVLLKLWRPDNALNGQNARGLFASVVPAAPRDAPPDRD